MCEYDEKDPIFTQKRADVHGILVRFNRHFAWIFPSDWKMCEYDEKDPIFTQKKAGVHGILGQI